MSAPTVSGARVLPEARSLTWDQAAGRACVWCNRQLTSGAVSVGIVRSRQGVHVLDVEVWAGPCCREGLA